MKRSHAAAIGLALMIASTASAQRPGRQAGLCSQPLLAEVAVPNAKLPRFSAHKTEITYWIIGLGRANLIACAKIDGQSFNRSITISRRAAGLVNPPGPGADLFDGVTGKHWNWVGFVRSGGKDLAPGAVGDVSVPCLNRFDCIARNHDIFGWLGAHFEQDADVRLADSPLGNAASVPVMDPNRAHGAAVADFIDAARVTLRNVKNRGLQRNDAHGRNLAARAEALLSRLTLEPGKVIAEILNDAELQKGIPPR